MAEDQLYTIRKSTLTDIGDSIREQTGTAEQIAPDNMPAAIKGISGVTLDTTLTQAGQAADAKAVGDAFAQATEDIEGALQQLSRAIPAVDDTLTQSGQAADAKAVGDTFEQLQQMAESLLPQLPPGVTTADNGKILQVVDGAWAAVTLTDVSEVGM